MVALSEIFERLVMSQIERKCPQKRLGRPRDLDDTEALRLICKVLRTGMQWREVEGSVHHALAASVAASVVHALR